MPYVGPATGQVIPRRSRRDKPALPASASPSSSSTPLPLKANASAIGVDNADLLTPRPISHQASVDALADNFAAASIQAHDQAGPSRTRQGSDGGHRADRTSKRSGSDGQASSGSKSTSASDADLSASESSASLTSLSTQSEIGTPPTTSTTPEMLADVEARALGEGAVAGAEGVEVRVMRYREGLYAYTRNLYLEAKLSQTRKAGGTIVNQFGLKQSGMERLAAKKALARRLNA